MWYDRQVVTATVCMADNRVPSFLIGLGVGVAIGLLAAPKSGVETMDDLRKTAEEGKDFVLRSSRELRDVAEQALEKGQDVVDAQRASLESAYRAGMDAYRQASGEHL